MSYKDYLRLLANNLEFKLYSVNHQKYLFGKELEKLEKEEESLKTELEKIRNKIKDLK